MTNQTLPDLYYRYFRCPSCGYQEQVAGEKFYDEAYREYMDTFFCMDCHIIHEKMVTESTLHSTLPAYLELKEIFPEFDLHLPGSFRDYSVLETVLFAEDKVVENIECYSCGSKRNINWSKELPYCPKCRQTMETKYKDRPEPVPIALYGNEEQQKIHQFALDNPRLFRELISAYYSFTEEEIFKYRNWIKWSLASENDAIQWNRRMIEHCNYYLNWEIFSGSPAFQDTKLIDEFIPDLQHKSLCKHEVSWAISCNEHIHWTEELIDRYMEKIDFYGLSNNSNVDWSVYILNKYEDLWDWISIFINNNIKWTLPMMEMGLSRFESNGILYHMLNHNKGMVSNLDIVKKYFNWIKPTLIFSNSRLPWHQENLLEQWADRLDWDGLSQNEELLRDPLFFEQNMKHWLENDGKRFSNLSSCVTLQWSHEFIERFHKYWDWSNMSYNPALPWSEEFIDQYADKWDWDGIFSNTGIPWSIDLILKYDLSDEETLFTNRSIWDKAFEPYMDKDFLEVLRNTI